MFFFVFFVFGSQIINPSVNLLDWWLNKESGGSSLIAKVSSCYVSWFSLNWSGRKKRLQRLGHLGRRNQVQCDAIRREQNLRRCRLGRLEQGL